MPQLAKCYLKIEEPLCLFVQGRTPLPPFDKGGFTVPELVEGRSLSLSKGGP